jgi:hypothetical protein
MKAEPYDDPNPVAAPVRPGEILRRLPECRTAEERRLMWFLQQESLAPGGLEGVARALVTMFPERLQTETMARIGTPPGGVYSEADARRIEGELLCEQGLDAEIDAALACQLKPEPQLAIPASARSLAYFREAFRDKAAELAGLLRNAISTRGWKNDCAPFGAATFPPRAPWFQDLPGALAELTKRKGAEAEASFYQTNVGAAVFETLDKCLARGKFGVLDGESGRGKSATVAAWAAARPGAAIIFEVPPDGNALDFYTGLARKLGVPCADTAAAGRIRGHLWDTFLRSGLMLVLDEAYRLLSHRDRDGRPRVLEWVYSMAEKGVPLVLCITQNFGRGLARIESEGWGVQQFTRRAAGIWTKLDRNTTPEHLEALAARLLPKVGSRGAKAAAAYAGNFRDVSGLKDLVDDARYLAGQAGRPEPVFEDLKRAIDERFRNDNAMALSLQVGIPRRRQTGRGVPAVAAEPDSGRAVERPRETVFEAVNGRLNALVLDPGRQAAAPLIHDVESPVLA